MWEVYKKGFKAYFQLEKSLSENSVEAYVHDIEKFTQFLSLSNRRKKPEEIELKHLEKFLQWINELGMTPSSQSRIISGLRNFYKYCHTGTNFTNRSNSFTGNAQSLQNIFRMY